MIRLKLQGLKQKTLIMFFDGHVFPLRVNIRKKVPFFVNKMAVFLSPFIIFLTMISANYVVEKIKTERTSRRNYRLRVPFT